MEQGIPIIDISPLLRSDTPQSALHSTIEEIRIACETVGFFYIRNHLLSDTLRIRMFKTTEQFFNLPIDRKMKVSLAKSPHYRGYLPLGGEVTGKKKDWHEAFDIGVDLPGEHPDVIAGKPLQGPNLWPIDLLDFKSTLELAWEVLFKTASAVVGGISLSLGLDREFFMTFVGDQSLSILRLSHYPPCTDQDADVGDGIGAHIDYGFVTILSQDDVGGLEVRATDNRWISAPNIPGTCLVNIGHMLQRWTNDRYRATRHRVRIPEKQSRFSIPFFFDPAYDTVVTPLEVCCDEENPARYESFHFGPYIAESFARSYAAHYK